MKKMLAKRIFMVLPVTYMFFICGSVNAAMIGVDLVEANWSNVVGGANVTGVGTNEIRWGEPATNEGRSGYRFDGAAPPSLSVEAGVEFTLGEFTHFNFPIIAGGAIESVQLDIMVDLSLGGSSFFEGPFTFLFAHDETPNTSEGCCNDIVDISNLMSTDSFILDGIIYTLAITGFKVGDVVTTSFSTIEGQENTAELRGVFRTASVSVPVPTSVLLLGLGLLVMFNLSSRKGATI